MFDISSTKTVLPMPASPWNKFNKNMQTLTMLNYTMMITGVFERMRIKSVAILKKLSFKIVILLTNLFNLLLAIFEKTVLP